MDTEQIVKSTADAIWPLTYDCSECGYDNGDDRPDYRKLTAIVQTAINVCRLATLKEAAGMECGLCEEGNPRVVRTDGRITHEWLGQYVQCHAHNISAAILALEAKR